MSRTIDEMSKSEPTEGELGAGPAECAAAGSPQPDQQASPHLQTSQNDEQRTVADKLVDLALRQYRIGRTKTDDAFAVEHDGPNVALMLRGSRDALRAALARSFRRAYRKVPSNAAMTDAIMTLQGEMWDTEPENVEVRLGSHDGKIVIDLGNLSGQAVIVGPTGWSVVDQSPVLFRRTALTGQLPIPERGGSLVEFRRTLNVTDETWPLALGWVLAALIPDVPHPVLFLGGQQGTGKTTAAKQLIGVIDPSPAVVRSQPRNERSWAVAAAGSWAIAIDNVSNITEWFSDALCKAVTGDAWVDRTLYSDSDVTVLAFRRALLLTSIDPGALRGDLADRALLVDLEPIDEGKRKPEKLVNAEYELARPRIFGAILDLLANVLAVLPTVTTQRLPRMADFGRILAALDVAMGGKTNALETFLSQRTRIATAVVESDAVALAIESLLERLSVWEGTTSQLLTCLTPPFNHSPKDWPGTSSALSGRLTRVMPALKQLGISVERLQRTSNRRLLRLTKADTNTGAVEMCPLILHTAVDDTGDGCDGKTQTACVSPTIAVPTPITTSYDPAFPTF